MALGHSLYAQRVSCSCCTNLDSSKKTHALHAMWCGEFQLLHSIILQLVKLLHCRLATSSKHEDNKKIIIIIIFYYKYHNNIINNNNKTL